MLWRFPENAERWLPITIGENSWKGGDARLRIPHNDKDESYL